MDIYIDEKEEARIDTINFRIFVSKEGDISIYNNDFLAFELIEAYKRVDGECRKYDVENEKIIEEQQCLSCKKWFPKEELHYYSPVICKTCYHEKDIDRFLSIFSMRD